MWTPRTPPAREPANPGSTSSRRARPPPRSAPGTAEDPAPTRHRIGLAGRASRRYVDEWIVGITDVTPPAHGIRALVRAGDLDAATARLPRERPHPL
ncbi:hypothetical protein GCM10010492_12250 [Saccharothrix mutabilis subsp. mutabilis]|uniref:Uncharacterized protein n=1 Tax=Saccharothrix mutabilis subsp. mutabilis TaxID=66855 RepID=A0ABN0T9M5_9PSEU